MENPPLVDTNLCHWKRTPLISLINWGFAAFLTSPAAGAEISAGKKCMVSIRKCKIKGFSLIESSVRFLPIQFKK
jgi:hypothetical protein